MDTTTRAGTPLRQRTIALRADALHQPLHQPLLEPALALPQSPACRGAIAALAVYGAGRVPALREASSCGAG